MGPDWARRIGWAAGRRASAALVLGALAGALLAAPAREAAAEPTYGVLYDARLDPAKRAMTVQVRVTQNDAELRTLAFRTDPARQVDWAGDGTVEQGEGRVVWTVPPGGGTLRYTFLVDQLRDERSYDARAASEWALFRGDDLVPPAAARTRAGAESRSRLRLRLPEGWSAVTPYPKASAGGFRVETEGRGFDRPTGWILVARRLGVVRETVAGVRVAVAGPAGQGLRRLDILALLRWTLPELRPIFPAKLPDRLLIVGAGDPMWRGGLSAPRSIFIHADRPLISTDGTSPLLHEVLHTILPKGSSASEDWLVEGLAEYYALEAMVRSKTVSKSRHEKTLKRLASRGRNVRSVRVEQSSGAITARAVALLADLDRRIREASQDAATLDDAIRLLAETGTPLALTPLRQAAEAAAGKPLNGFFDRPVFDLAVPPGT